MLAYDGTNSFVKDALQERFFSPVRPKPPLGPTAEVEVGVVAWGPAEWC